MRPLLLTRMLALLSATVLGAACERPHVPERELVIVARPTGTWQGSGDSTIGFSSETGRFRIHWETRGEMAPHTGTFRVTVHSAVSGRPLQVVAEHSGDGSGDVDFADDPRPYNLMVESANVEWTLRVDEVTVAYAKEPQGP